MICKVYIIAGSASVPQSLPPRRNFTLYQLPWALRAEMFPEMTAEEREALKRKHGTLHAILEAEEVVADRA